MNLNDISPIEQLTAIAVGIGAYFLCAHFHLMPPYHGAGRIIAQGVVGLGAGTVMLLWPLVFKKKDDKDKKP